MSRIIGHRFLARVQGQLLEADPHLWLLGEDVVRGGVAGSEMGLSHAHSGQVHDLAGSGGARISVAMGAAMAGHPVILHLPDADLLAEGLDALGLDAARLRHRSGGALGSSLVIRVGPSGAGGPGHVAQLSSWLASSPGLKVVSAGDPLAAAGLLRSAVADPDPVVLLEAAECFTGEVDAEADDGSAWPLGHAALLRSGDHVTALAWGASVGPTLAAAERCAAEGISVEVIDLRSLSPLDLGAIRASVERTGRAVVCHDGPEHGGFGAEVAAQVGAWSLMALEAPVVRACGLDAPHLRDARFSQPSQTQIYASLTQVARF